MLTDELKRAIKIIHIRSRRMVDTSMAGRYRSVFRGSGIEFEEVREYSPGDDVKRIDWKVSARMGRPFLKMYREERELIVMLLVDLSASGAFGTQTDLKREKATELAAVLAFNAIRNSDRVGAILFTDRVEKYLPPNKGAAHVWRVIQELLAFRPQGRGTDLACALKFLGSVVRKRSVSFLISDFIAADCRRDLKRVGKRHELIAALITDPGEDRPPEGGIITIEDLETGQRLLIDASDRRVRERLRARAEAHRRRRQEMIRSAGLDCLELATGASTVDALNRYLRLREQRLR